jgi:flavorubredoxin
MKPIEIAPGIYDVGINDWNISDFHGYSTPFGTSYNAYLVLDEKIALIDTVKSGFATASARTNRSTVLKWAKKICSGTYTAS